MMISTWVPIAISAAGMVISLSAFTYQIHRARFNQSVDLLFRIENDFFGGGKIAQRSLAARRYLADANDFREMEDILDFFETVAMLTRKRALDTYMVWHTFDYWIERYYETALPYIKGRQSREPGVWEDLLWLIPRLRKLQAKRSLQSLSRADLVAFMVEEANEA